MDDDDILKEFPKDGRVMLALLSKDVQHLTEKFNTSNLHNGKILELLEKKVDIGIYIADKNHILGELGKHSGRIRSLENTNENSDLRQQAKKEERDKILGLTKSTWLAIVQVIQILVLLGYIGATSN